MNTRRYRSRLYKPIGLQQIACVIRSKKMLKTQIDDLINIQQILLTCMHQKQSKQIVQCLETNIKNITKSLDNSKQQLKETMILITKLTDDLKPIYVSYQEQKSEINQLILQFSDMETQYNSTQISNHQEKLANKTLQQEQIHQNIINIKYELQISQETNVYLESYIQLLSELISNLSNIIKTNPIDIETQLTNITTNYKKQQNLLQQTLEQLKHDYFMQFTKDNHNIILSFPEYMLFDVRDNTIYCTTKTTRKLNSSERAEWGRIIAETRNVINGITTGFDKKLYLRGVGYKAVVQDNILLLHVGYSHSVSLLIPDNLKVTVEAVKKDVSVFFYESSHMIKISGVNKQNIGDFATKVLKVRKYSRAIGNGIIDPRKYLPRKPLRKTN